ncbi:hypothetical protein M426DRAFT_6863 [Hypoxylon sp. CI-4A]|nr:hypothetical protein M426DRAFT_6863 [Hypoxylon sp. CI-4A]
MSSLFQQAEANSTKKPSLTKYGQTASGEGSGMDEKPSTLSAGQLQGGQKTQPRSSQARVQTPLSETQRIDPGGKEVKDGIEHFET